MRLMSREKLTIADENRAGSMSAMSTAEIHQLPRAEKVRLMEILWEDLSRDEEAVESPAWHGERLRVAEQRLAQGDEHIYDWAEAKAKLRKLFE